MIDDGRSDRVTDHIVSIYARADQIGMLSAITLEMEVWMLGRPRRFVGGGLMIDYFCGDADVAAEFLRRWTDCCGM